MDCNKSYDVDYIRQSEGVPQCECGGIIKPDVVLFEEALDQDIISQAVMHISNADMLIIGGTSLGVYPAAGLIQYFGGCNLALINKGETPYDNRANLVINKSIGAVLSEVMQYLNSGKDFNHE